jgi:hypothetical protein
MHEKLLETKKKKKQKPLNNMEIRYPLRNIKSLQHSRIGKNCLRPQIHQKA